MRRGSHTEVIKNFKSSRSIWIFAAVAIMEKRILSIGNKLGCNSIIFKSKANKENLVLIRDILKDGFVKNHLGQGVCAVIDEFLYDKSEVSLRNQICHGLITDAKILKEVEPLMFGVFVTASVKDRMI